MEVCIQNNVAGRKRNVSFVSHGEGRWARSNLTWSVAGDEGSAGRGSGKSRVLACPGISSGDGVADRLFMTWGAGAQLGSACGPREA